MKYRVPLQIVEGRLVLTAVVECSKLRIQRQIMEFVIDTGSQNSYFGYKDVMRLHIPLSEKSPKGEVDVGGSRYKEIELPKMKFHILTEDKISTISLDVEFYALRTTKTSMQKIQIAQALPSIIGMNFLKDQRLSLHVIPAENIAYLEYDK